MFIATTTAAVASAGTFPIFVYVLIGVLVIFLAVGGLFALYKWCTKKPSSSSNGSSSRNDRTTSRGPTGGGGAVRPASHSNGGGGTGSGEGNAQNGMSKVVTGGQSNGGYEMGNLNDSVGRNDTGPLINATNGNGGSHSNGNGLAHSVEPIYQTLP